MIVTITMITLKMKERKISSFSFVSLKSVSVKTTNPANLLASAAVADDEEAHMNSEDTKGPV